jgi:hypothetical protein
MEDPFRNFTDNFLSLPRILALCSNAIELAIFLTWPPVAIGGLREETLHCGQVSPFPEPVDLQETHLFLCAVVSVNGVLPITGKLRSNSNRKGSVVASHVLKVTLASVARRTLAVESTEETLALPMLGIVKCKRLIHHNFLIFPFIHQRRIQLPESRERAIPGTEVTIKRACVRAKQTFLSGIVPPQVEQLVVATNLVGASLALKRATLSVALVRGLMGFLRCPEIPETLLQPVKSALKQSPVGIQKRLILHTCIFDCWEHSAQDIIQGSMCKCGHFRCLSVLEHAFRGLQKVGHR